MSVQLQQEKILVVEDAPEFQLTIRAALEKRYSVVVAPTLEAARGQLAKQRFDLLVLDVNLPDGDGFRFCAELRTREDTGTVPVIILTARTELEDKLRGFSLGADDYVVKPFQVLELCARVEAKLARQRVKEKSSDVFARGPLRLELATLRAFAQNGQKRSELGLTPIEFKILYHLVRNETQVVSREQLLATVWGQDTHVFDRATDKHVSSLRQKLGAFATYIETVSRVGYRFAMKPEA